MTSFGTIQMIGIGVNRTCNTHQSLSLISIRVGPCITLIRTRRPPNACKGSGERCMFVMLAADADVSAGFSWLLCSMKAVRTRAPIPTQLPIFVILRGAKPEFVHVHTDLPFINPNLQSHSCTAGHTFGSDSASTCSTGSHLQPSRYKPRQYTPSSGGV